MQTVAEQLRRTREQQRLSIEDVAEITKLRRDHVRALEAGDYGKFSASIYVRGSVRSYAALLKMDVPRLLEALQKEMNPKNAASSEENSLTRSKGILEVLALHLSRINWKLAVPVVFLIFLIAAGILGVQFWRHHQTRDPLIDLGKGEYSGGHALPIEHLPLPSSPTNQP